MQLIHPKNGNLLTRAGQHVAPPGGMSNLVLEMYIIAHVIRY